MRAWPEARFSALVLICGGVSFRPLPLHNSGPVIARPQAICNFALADIEQPLPADSVSQCGFPLDHQATFARQIPQRFAPFDSVHARPMRNHS